MRATGVYDLDRSPGATEAMVDTNERNPPTVTRPGRKGQLVVVPPRTRPDQNPEPAAVRTNRRQPSPRMWATACPAEHDRAAVGRPGRVHTFGRPSTGAEAARVCSVRVDDPQARAGTTWQASAKCNLAVTGTPAHARAVRVDATNAMDVAAVAVHHEQRARERVPTRLFDKGDPASVARPGWSAAVARQLLEATVWMAPEYPTMPDHGDRATGGGGRRRVRGLPSGAEHDRESDKPSENKAFRYTCHYSSKTPHPRKMFVQALADSERAPLVR